MNNVAEQAIKRSISHNEIVTLDLAVIPYDSAILTDLLVACDDSVDANDNVTEYWGKTEEGNEWRVHVRHWRYVVECRHVSGSSNWEQEPDTEHYETREAAEAVIATLEREDEEGSPLEYRVVHT